MTLLSATPPFSRHINPSSLYVLRLPTNLTSAHVIPTLSAQDVLQPVVKKQSALGGHSFAIRSCDVIKLAGLGFVQPQNFVALQPRPKTSFQHTFNVPDNQSSSSPEDWKKKQSRELKISQAIDRLAQEYPRFFSHGLADFSIYSKSIVLREPNIYQLKFTGLGEYKCVLYGIRYLTRMYFDSPAISIVHIHRASENEVVIKWRMEGISRADRFSSFLERAKRLFLVKATPESSVYHGSSIYRFDAEGLIVEHIIENIIPIPKKFGPLTFFGSWQQRRVALTE